MALDFCNARLLKVTNLDTASYRLRLMVSAPIFQQLKIQRELKVLHHSLLTFDPSSERAVERLELLEQLYEKKAAELKSLIKEHRCRKIGIRLASF